MKKIIKRKVDSKNDEKIHIKEENKRILAKIIYTPAYKDKFLYSLIIEFKETKEILIYEIGVFNLIKAKYSLGKIVLDEKSVKILPLKLITSVYNLHEKDIKEYTFPY